MPRTKHPYTETLTEKIERWATGAVTDDPAQQLALVSLLHAFSEAAGERGDDDAMINHAMYCAFKEADGIHDDAIAWVVSAGEEDRADAIMSKKRSAVRAIGGVQ